MFLFIAMIGSSSIWRSCSTSGTSVRAPISLSHHRAI